MKKPAGIAIAFLLTALFSLPVAAGEIDAGLTARIQSAGGSEEVAIIVYFDRAIDFRTLRRDFGRQLNALYPDPAERRLARKALKRALLVQQAQQLSQRSAAGLEQWLRGNGVTASRSLWAINALAVSVPASLVADIAAFPGVERVVSDAVVQGPGPGTAPSSPTYWNLGATGAGSLWALGHTGTGVVVATMDTGVDASHPDLGPRYRGGNNSWFDAYGQNPAPADFVGHGTQVLGLIVGGDAGGYQVGMAPDAAWIAAKVFDNANQATLSGLHAGFQWLLDPDGDPQTDDAPDIVNNSWALSATIGECSAEFAADIAMLKEAEIAVTFSGGNFGPKSGSSVSPANDTGSLSVGSVDDRYRVARSSSRGPSACDGGVYPKLVGPGEAILTTELMPNFYNIVSGTSYSVAHVSGGLALLAGAFPGATVTELESALTETAVDLGSAGPDDDFGYGLIDLAAAYDWLQNNNGGSTAGELQLSAAAYAIAENAGSLSITVTRVNGSAGDVTVDYATSDGTALAGQDYADTAGTLSLLDGETTRSFAVAILDDGAYEGDETFTVSLAAATGGATLGAVDTASVTITDNETPPSGGDNDGDGFDAPSDCNDNDASIYPGAPEIKHDGVDQDCNGFDLTIDITSVSFSGDQLVVTATSTLGRDAGLSARIELGNGNVATEAMSWKNRQGYWELKVRRFSRSYGADPVSVTVSGVEGSETTAL